MKSKYSSLYLLPIITLIVVALAPAPVSAVTDTSVTPSTVDLPLASWYCPVLPRIALSSDDEPPFLAQTDEQGGAPVDVYGFKRKSPTRAFLQSFLIPGWGQLYAKSSFWKPIMFVGIEAAGWAGYASFHGKGNDKEAEYRVFADAHWDSLKYVNGLFETFYSRDYSSDSIRDNGRGAWIDTATYRVVNEQNESVYRSLSHHAWYKEDGSAVERGEYYENIGKYNQFNFGWDDFPDVGSGDSFPAHPDSSQLTYVSPNRRTYLGMRDDANSEFNKANTMLVATVANHLIAGFWAALDARAFNRAQDQFSHIEPKFRLVKSPTDPKKLMPYLTVGYRF